MPPEIDIVDATWLGVRPQAVGAVLADRANWPRWWPELDLGVQQWRGPKGVRWIVRSANDVRLSGSMEVYLEPAEGGVVAHYFLRLGDSSAPRLSRRRRERYVRASRARIKRVLWSVADELDPGRLGRIAAPRSTPPGRAGAGG